jgi:hypothetical protein
MEIGAKMKKASNKVVRGLFGWVISFFGGTFKETISSIRTIKQAPMQNSITLATMLARIGALIMFAIAFATFIANNGYSEQVAIIGEGFREWSRAFTFGTLPLYISGAVPVIWTILLVLTFFAIHIVFVITEEGMKKLLMFFLLLVFFAGVVIYLLFAWGVIYERHMAITSLETLWRNIQLNEIPWYVPAIYLGAMALTLALASVIAVRSDLNRQMKQWLSTALSLYIGLPLILWLSQNLLGLAVTIAFLGIVGGVLYILFTILYSRLGDQGGRTSDGKEDDSTAGVYDSQSRRQGGRSASGPQNTVEVEPGAKLWKIKSVTGDYIQSEKGKGETAEVCTAADFDKGKVTIMQDGEPVSTIPWKPKK